MKKYVKPELFYENYELSQHIAACDWQMTMADLYRCSAEGTLGWLPTTVFTWRVEACRIKDLSEVELICYTSPSTDGWKVFNS